MNYKADFLVTGAGGMVGSHMVELLDTLNANSRIIGTYYKPTVNMAEIKSNALLVECDVRYISAVYANINQYKPDTIFHLAAQSYPALSWVIPHETMDTNVNGTLNIFEAIKQVRSQDPSYDPVVVVACSSAQYGAAINQAKVDESTAFQPLHPYGVSKVAKDLLSYQYFVNDGIRAIRARIFNTTGPRKKNDVISDFSSRLVQIERGEASKLRVGNIKTKRAILDVQDLLQALILLSKHGKPGEAYNICSDHVYLIEDIINIMGEIAGFKIAYEQDPNLLRKSDEAIIFGDNSKLKQDTSWHQTITIKDTVQRVVEYYRNQ